VGVVAASARQAERCEAANRFLVQDRGMVTRIDPDTLDDWRTGQRLAGCRITAAGIRTGSAGATARTFYQRLRTAGWERTPDPQDAPHEASLRFRRDETDCLFNVYEGILLGTESELAVTGAVGARRGRGEVYHVLAVCVEAKAAPPPGVDAGFFRVTSSAISIEASLPFGAQKEQ